MTGLRAVFMGAPGAGKGTQAARVAKRLELVHLSTGDLLRAAVAGGTEAGKQAKGFMDAGKLVPDEVVFGVLFERLQGTGDADGIDRFVLDGFPRNLAQAAELDRRLTETGHAIDLVIDIAVPDDRIVGRITGRRICRGCGTNYHVEFLPTKQDGVCDQCGGETYQRSDDDAETVLERLRVYHEQTSPLIEYYEDAGLLVSLNGNRDVDAITDDLVANLESVASAAGGGR